ncbi:MAG: discoidin domain-containing protein [Nanoarchaeota archaeon]
MKKRVHAVKKSERKSPLNFKRFKKTFIYTLSAIVILLIVLGIYLNGSRIISKGEDSPKSCTDSDSGKDYFSQGNVKIIYNSGKTEFFSDSCLDSGRLQEYSCEDKNSIANQINCEFGCFEGICLTQEEEISVLIAKDLALFCGEYKFSTPKNAFASSDYGNFSALDTLDFDANTHWFGELSESYPKWIAFDLGERKCIREADLYVFKRDLPLSLDLQVSNDNVRWKTLQKDLVLENITTIGVELPDTVLARYIRLYETSGKREFGTLAEIRLNIADFPEGIINE